MTRDMSVGAQRERLAVDDAVLSLQRGGLVAIPTETVYGLGADATNGMAVARIFEAKGRPSFNPLICHVANLAMAQTIAVFGKAAQNLAAAFWPGPLTLVLPAEPGSAVHPLVSAGRSTIAVRMARGIMSDIAGALGRPIAAPSANRSGKVSPTTAAHVEAGLGHRVDLILDGGPASIGLESTIVRPTETHVVLLRAGGIPTSEIEMVTGLPVVRPAPGAGIEAPGQLASHYAPHGLLRLKATIVEPGEALITFGGRAVSGEHDAVRRLDLSPSGDLREAASRLFATLLELDTPAIARIAVVDIPEEGLGEAINDRLRRAAAPRF